MGSISFLQFNQTLLLESHVDQYLCKFTTTEEILPLKSRVLHNTQKPMPWGSHVQPAVRVTLVADI